MELEHLRCEKCGRTNCWSLSDEGQTGPERYEEYTCKCGHSEYFEYYDCPVHGEMKGSECPRC